MSRREPMDPSTKAWCEAGFQGVGMLALVFGGPLLLRGLMTGQIRPDRIAARIPVYLDALQAAVIPAAITAAVLAVVTGTLLLTVRHGRAIVATWWRYRRRWVAVMADQGLAERTQKALQVPRVAAIEPGRDRDVVTVVMLPGQAPADWESRLGALAQAFGALAATAHRTTDHHQLELVFSRITHNGRDQLALDAAPTKALAALPAPTRPVVPIPIPEDWTRARDRVAIAWVVVLHIRYVLGLTDQDGHQIKHERGELGWALAFQIRAAITA